MKEIKNNKGFTLIELLIVVAIIAILASIAIVSYANYVKNAKISACMEDAHICLRLASSEWANSGNAVDNKQAGKATCSITVDSQMTINSVEGCTGCNIDSTGKIAGCTPN